MRDYDFSISADRSVANSEKWSEENIEGICGNRKALPFWVADMDLPTSDEIRKALEKEAERGVIGYRESGALIPAFISFMKKRHGCDVDPQDVVFAQGMLHSIAMALNLFTKPGDRVLLPYPSYHPFIDMIISNERVIVPYHLERTQTGFALNEEKFIRTAEGCNAILFCSPHNPTGIVFTEKELKTVLECASRLDIPVFCDEIHSDLAHPGYHHIPLYKASEGTKARCITFCAASKSFNIAGEHCAFALFSDRKMKQEYEKALRRLYLTSPGYSVSVMAENAYLHGIDYNTQLCAALERKFQRLESFIKENCPLIRPCAAHASFIAFLDCSALWDRVLEDKAAHSELYQGTYTMSHFFGQRGSICMNDGSWFGEEYAKYVRFNFGCGDDLLEKGLAGLKKAYAWIIDA